ncbi:hypothetical protein A4X06_0g9250 [Tilletia controversa]|uniref:Altered inheritance of mitochondria protein 41 n=2 Tax=Tilletia TaxID=13289 RepID=A0A8X7MJ59_9BASI|nr:hypothetical protein A4X06_0g9250 [Tilletia controversa]
MQIRRFSPLSFFLPAVLIGSIALGMVAGAPAPASADLEQHTAESFLKRTISNLEVMSLKELEALLESKKEVQEAFVKAMYRGKALEGTATESEQYYTKKLLEGAKEVKAEMAAISKAIGEKLFGSWKKPTGLP